MGQRSGEAFFFLYSHLPPWFRCVIRLVVREYRIHVIAIVPSFMPNFLVKKILILLALTAELWPRVTLKIYSLILNSYAQD